MPLKIRFTRKGRAVPGSAEEPPLGANDVHFEFTTGKEPAVFWYTKKGEQVGEKHSAPKDARDVGVEFGADEKGHFGIGDTYWTDAEHKPIGGVDGFIPPPEGADDWHLDVPGGQITDAYWTKNGKSYVPRSNLDVPPGVNDAHLTYVTAPTTVSRLLSELDVESVRSSHDSTQLTASITNRLALSRILATLEESLPAPGQPCGEPFTTTGDGNGEDDDKALDDAFTKAAFAAGRICARNKECTGAEFVKYIKVSYGGTKGAVTCSIEAQFKCVK